MKRERSPKVLLSNELHTFLGSLKPDNKFVKWIANMADALKENKFAGELIRKSQIPKVYVERFKVNNLYRYSHPEGCRSCYTILNECPHILDLMTHAEYDRVFGYKTT
jgi:hypothetical protein